MFGLLLKADVRLLRSGFYRGHADPVLAVEKAALFTTLQYNLFPQFKTHSNHLPQLLTLVF